MLVKAVTRKIGNMRVLCDFIFLKDTPSVIHELISNKLLQNWATSNTHLTILQDRLASNLDTICQDPLTCRFLTSPHAQCRPMASVISGSVGRMRACPNPLPLTGLLPGPYPPLGPCFLLEHFRGEKKGKARWKPEGGGRIGVDVPQLRPNRAPR